MKQKNNNKVKNNLVFMMFLGLYTHDNRCLKCITFVIRNNEKLPLYSTINEVWKRFRLPKGQPKPFISKFMMLFCEL
ncbi:MAG: hypothetical protein DI622_21140 [Chryseobacterium sp.]|nr:MAG: hypothetical protein DI622_21140 [Chryseobacterium sp.]